MKAPELLTAFGRWVAQGKPAAIKRKSAAASAGAEATKLYPSKTSRVQARPSNAQGRSARGPNWHAWNKDIEQPSYIYIYIYDMNINIHIVYIGI